MAKKTYVKLERKLLVAELDGTVSDQAGSHYGRLFLIKDEAGEVIGCVAAFITRTVKSIWGGELTDETIENLFLRILPYVPFEISISDLSALYPRGIELFIDVDNGYDQTNKIHSVKGWGNPYDLVKHLVFNGVMNDEQVEKDLLSYLHKMHLEDRNASQETVNIAKALFIDEETVFRCLGYLKDDGYVEGLEPINAPGIIDPSITTAGVRYVRNNFQSIHAGRGVIIMGNFVGGDQITTNIDGDNNNNAVNSNITGSFNITLANEKIDALKGAIEADYTGEDKQDLIDQVEEIKTLASTEGNFGKIRERLGGILARTAQFAGIVSAVITVTKLFLGGN